MSQFDDLYREIILDHYREPRNRGHIEQPDIAARGHNPLCGDEVDITMSLDEGRVVDVRFDGAGCSISQASASMLTELIEGKSLSDAERIAGLFKEMMLEDGDSRRARRPRSASRRKKLSSPDQVRDPVLEHDAGRHGDFPEEQTGLWLNSSDSGRRAPPRDLRPEMPFDPCGPLCKPLCLKRRCCYLPASG